MMAAVIANGKETDVNIPCTVDEFLQELDLPPRSVVVEPMAKPLRRLPLLNSNLPEIAWRSYELSPAVKVFCREYRGL